MSDQLSATKVASKMQELAEVLGEDLEDVSVEVRQDFGTKTLDGKAIKEAMDGQSPTETEDEQTPTESDDEPEQTPTESDDVEVHLEEMGYNELQALCSSELEQFPEDTTTEGLIEALEGNIGDVTDQTPTESEQDENDSDLPHPEDVDSPEKKHYVAAFGTCSEEGCSYGANGEEADYCASHQGSSSSSSSSSKKTKAEKADEVSDLYEISVLMAEKAVHEVSSGNFDTHSEAVEALQE
jgi:hypothetical protein